MATRSCITDAPLDERTGEREQKDDDKLKAGKYADALAKFIRNANTPVTIGIQGGWGSGKTSLFSLLRRRLKAGRTLCITVNAWEHSLFQGDNGKSTVVLSLLNGMVDAIGALANDSSSIDAQTSKRIHKEVDGANGILRTIGRILPMMAQMGISWATGATVAAPRSDAEAAEVEIPQVAQQIRELRKKLNTLVNLLPPSAESDVRLVVFIDDLDRVAPPTAVEILDVTKNIFDIEGCVFVLAIDYEVVVKGLVEKFGERTSKNEREFRQYFDKIIQIPFTMPIGAYSKEINVLLEKMLRTLDTGHQDGGELEEKTLKSLAKTARLATGSIPRSIKRIVNTLSLLEYIENEKVAARDDRPRQTPLEARFIIVALHINFPEICARLMERLDFTQWSLARLEEAWDLKYQGENEKKLDALQKNSELGKYFDEDWEKVLYCLCTKSDWLNRNVVNISRIMNQLRDVLTELDDETEESEDAEPESDNLSPQALAVLTDIMESIRVVSLDNELQSASMDSSAQGQDEVTRFCRKVDEKLRERLPKLVPENSPEELSAEEEEEGGGRFYIIPLEGEFAAWTIGWIPDEESIFIALNFMRMGVKAAAAKQIINDFLPEEFDCGTEGRGQNGTAFIGTSIVDWKKSDFSLTSQSKVDVLVETALEVYDLALKAQKKLRQSLRG